MKKPASLQTVLDVLTLKRDDALRALGQAQRERQQAEVQLTQLQDYSRESDQRWTQRAMQHGISPTLLQTQRQFMAKLEHAVSFQNGVLQRLQLNIDHCQQQLLAAERELASLNKYADRREQQWQTQLNRQEQRHNDEMAANLHRQNQHSHPWRSTP